MKIIIKHTKHTINVLIHLTPLQVLILQSASITIFHCTNLTTLSPHDSSHQDYYEVFTLKVLLREKHTTYYMA